MEHITSIKTSTSAIADVIGYRDKEGILQSPRTPFSSGTAVMLANEDLIRNVLRS